MKPLHLIISFICTVYSAKETMYDLLDMVNNAEFLAVIEKRLRDGDHFEDDSLGNSPSNRNDDDSCYITSGTIRNGCSFYSNASTIIKTKESLARGAKYLRDFTNISCPKECTSLCCENPECDVSIYQDKEEHSCYLFKCGEPSQCVFYAHDNYWMSSISETISKTHIYTPSVATHSHENELVNLHADTTSLGVKTTPTSRKDVTTTKKPELGSNCDSYKTECEDPHAECLFKTCRCRAGYHSKYGICRKHCGDEEFECDNIAYGTDSGQCIQNQFVCDDKSDCVDSSDELDCTNKKALLDVNLAGYDKLYKSPFYNPPAYKSDSDDQYQYGFPFSDDLTNQLQVPVSSNQVSNDHVPTNGNVDSGQMQRNWNDGGQYFYPRINTQNQDKQNLVPAAGKQQWSLQSGETGSHVHQDNIVHQQYQQNVLPEQMGHDPVAINAQSSVHQVNAEMPSVQQPIPNQNSRQNSYQGFSQQILPIAAQKLGPHNLPTDIPQVFSVNKQMQQSNSFMNEPKGSFLEDAEGQEMSQLKNMVNTNDSTRDYKWISDKSDSYKGDRYHEVQYGKNDMQGRIQEKENNVEDKLDVVHDKLYSVEDKSESVHDKLDIVQEKQGYAQEKGNAQRKQDNVEGKQDILSTQDHVHGLKDNIQGQQDNVVDKHLAETNDYYGKIKTYPPSTKTKTQIGFPTQSTIPGQKVIQSHGNSEGFPDYSWLNYENNNQRISGKKGKTSQSYQSTSDNSKMTDSNIEGKSSKSKQINTMQDTDNLLNSDNDVDSQYGSKINSSRYSNQVRNWKYGMDIRNPDGTDPRYPESYPRQFDSLGRSSSNQQPSYNRYDNRYDSTHRRPNQEHKLPLNDDSFQKGRDRKPYQMWHPIKDEYYFPDIYEDKPLRHEQEYDDIMPDLNEALPVRSKVQTPQRVLYTATEATRTSPVNKQPEKVFTTYVVTKSVVQTEAVQVSPETDKPTVTNPVSDHRKLINQAIDGSKNSNISTAVTKMDDSSKASTFHILNADSVEVLNYIDSSQGPIIALALGLAITLFLLIFVGCRLRTVKRRLRKGRALHSNEADYLINGMYL